MSRRFRVSTDTQRIGTIHWMAHYVATNSWQNVGDYSTPLGQLNYMADVSTPDFFTRIANGEIINNPMEKGQLSLGDGGGSLSGINPAAPVTDQIRLDGDGSVTSACIQRFVIPTVSYYAKPDDPLAEAKFKALEKIDSVPYALLEDYAELGKTFQTLRDPFRALKDLTFEFNEHRTGRFNRNRRARVYDQMDWVRATSSTWLEYRFAIGQIMRTAEKFLKEYEDSVIRRATGIEKGSFFKPRRESRASVPLVPKQWDQETTNAAGSARLRNWGETSGIASAGILYEVTNPLATFTQTHGLRLKDAPRVGWNLIPYTWAIDRFVNISGFITGVINLSDPKVKILTAWEKHDTNTVVKHQFLGLTSPGWTYSLSADILEDSRKLVVRNPWVPTFFDAVPKVQVPTDVYTLLDFTAVILRNLRGNPPRSL